MPGFKLGNGAREAGFRMPPTEELRMTEEMPTQNTSATVEQLHATATEPRAKVNGGGSGTLNHLGGSGPMAEWNALVEEESRLVERLNRVAAARARLEVHMQLAGTRVTRSVGETQAAQA